MHSALNNPRKRPMTDVPFIDNRFVLSLTFPLLTLLSNSHLAKSRPMKDKEIKRLIRNKKKKGRKEEKNGGGKQRRGSGHRGAKDFRAARVEGRAAAASREP